MILGIGFKPPAISRMFDLNCRSLRYHLKKQTPNVIRVAIDDSELDARVADIIDKFPAIGNLDFKRFWFSLKPLTGYVCFIDRLKTPKGLLHECTWPWGITGKD